MFRDEGYVLCFQCVGFGIDGVSLRLQGYSKPRSLEIMLTFSQSQCLKTLPTLSPKSIDRAYIGLFGASGFGFGCRVQGILCRGY